MLSFGCKVMTYDAVTDLPVGWYLQLRRPGDRDVFIFLGRITMLGRDLCGSDLVDSHYAVLKRKTNDNRECFYIQDNCSARGTFVNGVKLREEEERFLAEDDVISLGQEGYRFLFKFNRQASTKAQAGQTNCKVVYVSEKFESQETLFDSNELDSFDLDQVNDSEMGVSTLNTVDMTCSMTEVDTTDADSETEANRGDSMLVHPGSPQTANHLNSSTVNDVSEVASDASTVPNLSDGEMSDDSERTDASGIQPVHRTPHKRKRFKRICRPQLSDYSSNDSDVGRKKRKTSHQFNPEETDSQDTQLPPADGDREDCQSPSLLDPVVTAINTQALVTNENLNEDLGNPSSPSLLESKNNYATPELKQKPSVPSSDSEEVVFLHSSQATQNLNHTVTKPSPTKQTLIHQYYQKVDQNSPAKASSDSPQREYCNRMSMRSPYANNPRWPSQLPKQKCASSNNSPSRTPTKTIKPTKLRTPKKQRTPKRLDKCRKRMTELQVATNSACGKPNVYPLPVNECHSHLKQKPTENLQKASCSHNNNNQVTNSTVTQLQEKLIVPGEHNGNLPATNERHRNVNKVFSQNLQSPTCSHKNNEITSAASHSSNVKVELEDSDQVGVIASSQKYPPSFSTPEKLSHSVKNPNNTNPVSNPSVELNESKQVDDFSTSRNNGSSFSTPVKQSHSATNPNSSDTISKPSVSTPTSGLERTTDSDVWNCMVITQKSPTLSGHVPLVKSEPVRKFNKLSRKNLQDKLTQVAEDKASVKPKLEQLVPSKTAEPLPSNSAQETSTSCRPGDSQTNGTAVQSSEQNKAISLETGGGNKVIETQQTKSNLHVLNEPCSDTYKTVLIDAENRNKVANDEHPKVDPPHENKNLPIKITGVFSFNLHSSLWTSGQQGIGTDQEPSNSSPSEWTPLDLTLKKKENSVNNSFTVLKTAPQSTWRPPDYGTKLTTSRSSSSVLESGVQNVSCVRKLNGCPSENLHFGVTIGNGTISNGIASAAQATNVFDSTPSTSNAASCVPSTNAPGTSASSVEVTQQAKDALKAKRRKEKQKEHRKKKMEILQKHMGGVDVSKMSQSYRKRWLALCNNNKKKKKKKKVSKEKEKDG